MSSSAYAEALTEFVRSREAESASWQEMLSSLCPEFLEERGREIEDCGEPSALALFSSLLLQINQELQELGGATKHVIAASFQSEGYAYQVESIDALADLRGLIELSRFGVALDLNDESLEKKIPDCIRENLRKDVRGAWKVAQRRWKRFSSSAQKLHAAGEQLHTQARRVESALSLALSDSNLLCSRADLATDWLAGVDLWLHRPKASVSKGQALALSLLKSPKVEQKKNEAAKGTCILWTPSNLAQRLVVELSAPGADAAQALWVALGKPVDPQLMAQRLRASLLDLGAAKRGAHPISRAPQLVGWLRQLRLEAK